MKISPRDLLGNNGVANELKGEQVETVSDKLLDGAANVVNKVAGNEFEDQIEEARSASDKASGDE